MMYVHSFYIQVLYGKDDFMPRKWSCSEYILAVLTGCLLPTPTDNLYTLAGIAPPDIRQDGSKHEGTPTPNQ